jgi:hypothetical protein
MPECRELIDEAYAHASALVFACNTVACGLANDMNAYADVGAVLAGVLSVLVYFQWPFLLEFTLCMSVLPLIGVGLWFRSFGRFRFGDERYLKARRKMTDSLKKWVIVCALQLALLILNKK